MRISQLGQKKIIRKSFNHVRFFVTQAHGPWNSPGQNTGVGSCSLLQGIFPTQGLNPGLLHCRQILYQLSHKGSPGILEWVVYPFSSGSFQPRNWTRVSCIAGSFFTSWATKEPLGQKSYNKSNIYLICPIPQLCSIETKIFIIQYVVELPKFPIMNADSCDSSWTCF